LARLFISSYDVSFTAANTQFVNNPAWIINLDQHWHALRFTRKFWEFYLSNICRGKEFSFESEVVNSLPNIRLFVFTFSKRIS
jgi:hypothetical protein